MDFHRAKGSAGTLVLKRMQDPLEFGIVMTSEDGRVERFLEKPTWGQVFSDTVNTGIYVLEPEVLDLIPPEQPFDFSSELFPLMLDKGLPLFGYITDSYWTDVGNADAYLQANHDVLARKVDVEIAGFEMRPNVWVGEDVDIHPSARLEEPCLLGNTVQVGAGAHVGPYTVVGDNTIVGDDARLERAVVMDLAEVSAMAVVQGGALGRAASLGRGAMVEDSAVVGDEAVVGAGALVKSGVKIYGARSVEAGAIVTQSVVRERRASRSLFGARGVSGLVNIGVTAQVAVRLGMAYASTLKRGSVVVSGRDASRAARTMKRAVIAGLNSAGVHCHDLELTPMPMTRFTVRAQQAAGGVSVRTSPGHPEVLEIRLFDADGGDLPATSQRAIDRVFYREDYRRPGPAKLGELEFPPRALEQYTSGLLAAIDVEEIRRAKLKVVVDYAFGPASLIGPSVLGRLGCDVLAVNAFTDEHRPVLVADDLAHLLHDLADHVRNSGSNVGVLLEPGGEIAHLIDDRGRSLAHPQALLAFLDHEAQRAGGTLVVPVSCPSECASLVEAAGASLQWVPTPLAALMTWASRDGVTFAGSSDGSLIFPSFMPAPDGLMTFCKTLEMLAHSSRPLSQIADGLPALHLVERDVRVPWQLKGAVMRHVASNFRTERIVLLDGVKVLFEDGSWALVIPDPEEPRCRIWAEARTTAAAEALADHMQALVAQVVDGQVTL